MWRATLLDRTLAFAILTINRFLPVVVDAIAASEAKRELGDASTCGARGHLRWVDELLTDARRQLNLTDLTENDEQEFDTRVSNATRPLRAIQREAAVVRAMLV